MGDAFSMLADCDADCCADCFDAPEEIALAGAGLGVAGGAAALYFAFGGKRPSMRHNNDKLQHFVPRAVPLPTIVSYDRTKYALLIGINYTGTRFELDGCVNDVRRVGQFLSHLGYYAICLTDDQPNPNYLPTKTNILNGLYHLLGKVHDRTGYKLWLHFSGHGSQVHDKSGDESDGLDETICPIDFLIPQDGEEHGMITDDMLNEVFVCEIPAGNFLFAVFDCCHSGTVLDLPYYAIADKNRKKKQQLVGDQFSDTMNIECDAVLLSGCEDAQKSADVKDVGAAFVEMKCRHAQGAGGILTTALLHTLEFAKGPVSLYHLLSTISVTMYNMGFNQIPQLSASKPYSLKSAFEP